MNYGAPRVHSTQRSPPHPPLLSSPLSEGADASELTRSSEQQWKPACVCDGYTVVASCTNMISTRALAVWILMLATDVGQAFVPTGGAGASPFVDFSGHQGPAVAPMGSRRCRGRGHDASMVSSVAPAPRTKAEKTSEHFKLDEGGMVEFGSGQRVEVCV